MASPYHGKRSFLPGLDPHTQSHCLLRRPPTGPHEDLIKLVAICDMDPSLVPLRVALVFGFLGYLRISNLAPPTAQSFDPAWHSFWADVRPCKQGLLLDLKWTKTLQIQQGVTTIPLVALLDNRICPVATWQLYHHMLPWIPPDRATPLLLTTAPPVGKSISASTLRAMFHRAADAAGLSSKRYTPHSLRRGGASFCFQAGVPLEHIKKHDTWTSNAVDRYLLQHQAIQTPIAQAFFRFSCLSKAPILLALARRQ